MDDQADLEGVRKSFGEAVEKLPDTLDGLANLVTEAFWALVRLGMEDRRRVKDPVLWANDEVGGMLVSFFVMHEFGLDLETENWPWIERLRADLLAQGAIEMMRMEEHGPLLDMLERAGEVLHSPAVPFLIKRGFNRLAFEVTQALRALQANCTDSPEKVLKGFQELKSLTKGEIRIIMRATKTGERGKGAARLLAAELAGGRCGLDTSTVLKYAQPGRPKAKGRLKPKHKRQN